MLTGDIKSPYVDYEYYSTIFSGTEIPKNDNFTNVELEAEAYVDAVTFGRVQKLESIPDCVKNAICAAAEAIYEYMNGRNQSVKSESNDGYSVTYTDGISSEDCQKRMKSAVKRYLANTGLLYKGWSKKYDRQC